MADAKGGSHPASPAALTGREAAIDAAAKRTDLEAPGIAELDQVERFARAIGAAAIAIWGDLPPSIQEQLFERAVVLGHHDERDEMLREQLTKFLHDHHRRTAK